MAKIYYDTNGFFSGPEFFKPGTNQNITVAGTSAATTNAFGPTTKAIRVVSTTAAYIALATTPTADTTGIVVPANTPMFIVLPSAGLKLAALQVSAGGVMSVTELL